MSKLRAFLFHLTVSAVVVGVVSAIIFFIWYPYPYFQISGAWNVVRVLIGVDLVLGPLLTLLLFKPQKPGLVFDLSVIVAIQLAALIYGVNVIFDERPYFAIFVVDRFEILAKKDVDISNIENDELKAKPWAGPILAVAKLPDDEQERQRLMNEVLFEGLPDIHRRPEYWSPYSTNTKDVMARAKNLTELQDDGKNSSNKVSKFIRGHKNPDQLAYLPVVGKKGAFALVLDKTTKMPVDLIDVDPWDLPAS